MLLLPYWRLTIGEASFLIFSLDYFLFNHDHSDFFCPTTLSNTLGLNSRKDGKVPFAGCVCLSGWLTLKDELSITDEVAKSTPLFWAHGQYDDKVLFEQQAHGVDILKKQGVDITHKSYPMGHQSDPDEIELMAEFLERVLYPTP